MRIDRKSREVLTRTRKTKRTTCSLTELVVLVRTKLKIYPGSTTEQQRRRQLRRFFLSLDNDDVPPSTSGLCFLQRQERRLLTKKLKANGDAHESTLGFALNFYDALTDKAAPGFCSRYMYMCIRI